MRFLRRDSVKEICTAQVQSWYELVNASALNNQYQSLVPSPRAKTVPLGVKLTSAPSQSAELEEDKVPTIGQSFKCY